MSARRLSSLASTLVLFMLLCLLPASAETLGPRQFIESLGEETIGAITRENISEEARFREFERLFRMAFDVDAISRFVLGRYWRRATKEQQGEYQSLFADFIVHTYASRFRQYSGETLAVNSERKASGRDTIVSSQINTPEGPSVRVDWRVRTKRDDHKVVDVIVEGVSMAITQRHEFASVIRRGGGGIETLIAELRKKSKPTD